MAGAPCRCRPLAFPHLEPRVKVALLAVLGLVGLSIAALVWGLYRRAKGHTADNDGQWPHL